jgi:uncharacterized protein (UPF0335 family)
MAKGYFQTEDEVRRAIMKVLKNFEVDIETLKEGIKDVKKDMKNMDFDLLVELYNTLVEEEQALNDMIKGI